LTSGSLNLLEPYGPVQACNEIALPLTFIGKMYLGQNKYFRMNYVVILKHIFTVLSAMYRGVKFVTLGIQNFYFEISDIRGYPRIILGKPRCRWEDIRMYFKTEWKRIGWVHLDEYMDQCLTVLYTVMKI
jgi:hypothetical protein